MKANGNKRKKINVKRMENLRKRLYWVHRGSKGWGWRDNRTWRRVGVRGEGVGAGLIFFHICRNTCVLLSCVPSEPQSGSFFS